MHDIIIFHPSIFRCKCEVKTSINGERDLKADVSYVTYRFMRASITNSDCSDLHRCADVCRDYSKFKQELENDHGYLVDISTVKSLDNNIVYIVI